MEQWFHFDVTIRKDGRVFRRVVRLDACTEIEARREVIHLMMRHQAAVVKMSRSCGPTTNPGRTDGCRPQPERTPLQEGFPEINPARDRTMTDKMPDRPAPACIYCRVSTTDQSLDSQLRDLREYCRTRGWEPAEYVDHGISGTRTAARGGTGAGMPCRRAVTESLIVHALDRIGRRCRIW